MGKKPNFVQKTIRRVLGIEKAFDLNSMFLTGSEIPYSSITGGGIGDAYKSSAVAYACIRRQAVDISSVPLVFLSDPDNINSKIDTPIKDLFEQPNGWTSREQFLQQMVIMTLLRGEMFTVFDSVDKPTKMYAHYDSKDWTELVTEAGELVAWKYKNGQKDFTKLPSEILNHRLPTPYSPYRGQSPLTSAVDAMNIAKYTDSLHANITARGGEAGVVYKTAQELTPEQNEQLLSGLKAKRKNVGKSAEDVILTGGLEIVPPSFTKAEVDILTLRQPAIETVCQVYGMSPTLIGQANESNYSTFRGYLKIYWLQTLLPFLRGLENSFDRYFAGRHGVYVRFDTRAIDSLQDYLGERKETAKMFYQMGVPMSELNRRLNLGFDVENVISADECLMPVNMAPMSILANGEHIPALAGTESKEAVPSDIPIKSMGIPSESQQIPIKPDGELPLVSPFDKEKQPSISIPFNRRVAKSAKKYKGLLRRELLNQKDSGSNREAVDGIVGRFASRVMLEGCVKALVCADNTDATWDEMVKAVTIKSVDEWEDTFTGSITSLVPEGIDELSEKERKDAYNKLVNGVSGYLNTVAEMAAKTGFQLQLLDLGIDIKKE
jgi:HK97 family phage portal protein